MKKHFLILAVIIMTALSCKRNVDQSFNPRSTRAGHLDGAAGLPVAIVPSVISSNITLTSDVLWVLSGRCYVTNGATLTIDEGTYIAAAKTSTRDSTSAIIVTRGSMINAQGSEDFPIVFTSYQSCPQAGDWGGIVLLGSAPLNKADTTFEGIALPTLPAGIDVAYGGGDACQGNSLDNSGTLSFVRIEYSGIPSGLHSKITGLTCAGVGAGTQLNHIEVAYSADDAFQFLGGTVNAKYLVALAPRDDAYSFDEGYTGNIQFAVSILHNGLGYSANPYGIESLDNNSNSCKMTRPVISNMTIVGLCDSAEALGTAGSFIGAGFSRGGAGAVRNSVVMGYPIGVAIGSINFEFKYNTVQAYVMVAIPEPPGIDDTNRKIISGFPNSPFIDLVNPCDACSPDFRPNQGSTLLTDSVNYTELPAFFTPKTYRGACASGFGPDATWPRAGWIKYEYEPYCMACD